MISAEQENKDKVNAYLSSLSNRALRTSAEILDIIRNYQVVFRLLLIFEFLQLLYFSTSPLLNMEYSLSVFQYMSYLCSFLQFGKTSGSASQSSLDIYLYVVSTISILSVSIVLLLPLVLVTEKKPFSALANVCIKIAAFYFMLFESVLLLPFAQMGFYSMVCNPSLDYYKGNTGTNQTSTAVAKA